MNRSSVAAIAVCAALLGVGAGYLLAPRERACASAALDQAQAGLGHPGDPPALDASPCGGEGASRLTGRIRLSSALACDAAGRDAIVELVGVIGAGG